MNTQDKRISKGLKGPHITTDADCPVLPQCCSFRINSLSGLNILAAAMLLPIAATNTLQASEHDVKLQHEYMQTATGNLGSRSETSSSCSHLPLPEGYSCFCWG